METLGQRLQRLREEQRLTVYEVAKRTGMAPWVLSKLESRADLGNVQVRMLKRLAAFYRVTVDYLIHDVPEEQPEEELEPVGAV